MTLKDRNKPTGATIVADEEGRKLADAIAGQDAIAQGLRIAGTETAMNRNRTRYAIDREPPFRRVAAMDEGKAAMACQIVKARGHSVRFQIGRRRTGDETMRRERSGHQPTILSAADPNGEINTFLDQIDITVGEADIHNQFRPLLHETVQDRQDMHSAKRDRHVESQPPAWFLLARRHHRFCFIKICKDALASLVEGRSFVRQADAARRAMQKAQTQTFFQPHDTLAHSRARQTNPFGRHRETARIRCANECDDVTHAIKIHDTSNCTLFSPNAGNYSHLICDKFPNRLYRIVPESERDLMTTALYDRRYWLLLAVCIASFLEPLATTVVTVSLPQIQRATGASFAELQWVLNAYVLTFAALVLTGGALADRFGRKRIFYVGLWMFITASLVCGIANDPLLLIVGRAVAGTGSAFMLSAGLALLVQVFHGKERVRAFAIWGVVVGAGSALGPLVGGLLTDNLGWRWIFFINLPVCLPLLWLSHWSVGESRDPQSGAIDWIGLGSFTGMFLLLMYALIEGNNLGWTNPALIALLVVSAALLAIFIRVQLRRPRPMFDLSLFANPTFTGASIIAIAIAAAFFTLLVYLPIYIQGVLGYSPSQTGLALVVMAVPLLVMGPVSARMAAVISPKLFLPFGLLIIAGGGFLLSLVDQYGATTLYAGMIVTGVGAGLINGELSNVAISVVAPERSGMASGINNTMRQLGFGIGIAGLGAIFSANLTHGLSQYDRAFVERVASGDVVAAASDIGSDPAGAIDTATATLASAISDLSLWAAALAAAAAVLAFLLIRPAPPVKANAGGRTAPTTELSTRD